MKGLIILFGESFRLGGQHARNRGDDNSYNGQIEASKSQIMFIEKLEKNMEIRVFIVSYKTKFREDIKNIFSKYLIKSKFFDELKGQTNLINYALRRIKMNKYDFIKFMRIDIFLKKRYLDIFNPFWDKIMFPSICFSPHNIVKDKDNLYPRVSDIIMFTPKKYYFIFKNYNFELNHFSWKNLVKDFNIKKEDIDTMLYTYHDSDSAKDYNPIYQIVNRKINKEWKTRILFDKHEYY